MSDTRTLHEKLRAMADQDVSPNEAAIARTKLDAMGAAPPMPPRRPPAVGAPAPMPFTWSITTAGSHEASEMWIAFSFVGRRT